MRRADGDNRRLSRADSGRWAASRLRLRPHPDSRALASKRRGAGDAHAEMVVVAEYRVKGPGGEVLSMPLKGGVVKPAMTGFVAPMVGLGAHAGWLYVGELAGQVFRVKP